VLNHNGRYRQHRGYITDIMNELALDFVDRRHSRPFSLFLAHKAVHPDAEQAADGTLKISAQGGYVVAERHQGLYAREVFPPTPNMLSPADVVKSKPAWAECFDLRSSKQSRQILKAVHSGTQREIRLRAQMMAAVDEGVGALLSALERRGQLDNTCIVFLGDNGYFFGEHGLGPERRFAYEEGIRSPFAVRYPSAIKPGSKRDGLVICQDIAPTLIELAGGTPGPQIQGRSLLPMFASARARLRRSLLVEYWAENAMPWLVGMSYKAVRTDRYKYIHWVNRGRDGELDELYDLESDPWELNNLNASRSHASIRARLRRDLGTLVKQSVGL
jgi:N-acetylglucosamine-6-sulfatase